MTVTTRVLTGEALAAALEDVARLRIRVFHDFPYLYDGDADYERDYLRAYQSPGAVVVAATSDQPPLIRRRCAWAAMAVAEHFRDQGRHVLFLADSITRFAEAHREIALAAGEPPSYRGFPPSVSNLIMALAERSGPGLEGAGDITGIFSVLVAGSDMEEPVADILRGTLDGHVVLDRTIAERGRFPAVDVVRSVSRSLPDAASAVENAAIGRARAALGAYAESELMIRAGLYAPGSDAKLDEAVRLYPQLDEFVTRRCPGIVDSFAALEAALRLRVGELRLGGGEVGLRAGDQALQAAHAFSPAQPVHRVAQQLPEGDDQEVPERVVVQGGLVGGHLGGAEAVLHDVGPGPTPVGVVAQGGQRHAEVAGRQHRHLPADGAGGAAVVRHRDDGREVPGHVPQGREGRGEAVAAAEGGDPGRGAGHARTHPAPFRTHPGRQGQLAGERGRHSRPMSRCWTCTVTWGTWARRRDRRCAKAMGNGMYSAVSFDA